MRRLGQSLAIAGAFLLFSPEWVPLDPWLVRGAAAALFLVGLTAAVMGAVLGSLPEAARMSPLEDDAIPVPCVPLVERIESLGFTRLGTALRVHLEPEASLVPFWHAGERTYSTVFASDGAPAQAFFDFVTVFEPGTVGLTSAANRTSGVLPPTHGGFLQIFPGAEPETLLERHREAREHLARAAGVQPKPLCRSFEDLLAMALRHQRHAFLRAPLRHTWTVLWRMLTRTTPALGPLEAQRATRDRLDALADPLARAEADEALSTPALG